MADSQQNINDSVKSGPLNPPITMKVDAPVEDSCKQENEDNEKKVGEEFKICSPLNRPPAASANPFATTPSRLATRGILKPPQLSLNNSSSNAAPKPSFILNPSRLNPLVNSSASSNDKKAIQVNGETPKFVPLIQTENKTTNQVQGPAAATTTSRNLSSSATFIFGQNLQARVLASENKADDAKPSTSLNTNGTTEMLFSSAIKNEVRPDAGSASCSKETKSLSESAREYEESRASKRKYEEVEVKTGEEDETNILNITCRLFAFDKTSGWQERGRGVLRLNDLEGDDGHTQSRLVFRTTGSLRVVLNTKIWAEMTVEQASEKSVRFTALDPNGEIKVFLAMAGIDDSKHLCAQIMSRVMKEIASQKHKKLHTDEDTGSSGN